MKVIYVTPGLGRGGGAERSLTSLVPHWQNVLDLEVVTFSERAELAGDIIDAGATVTNLDGQSVREVVPELRRLIKMRRPTLVHSVLFDADVAARLATPAGIPVSSSLVNVNYGPEQWGAPGRSRWKVTAAQAIDGLTAQRVTRFHALSSEVASIMSKRLRVSQDVIEIIPRGRDREEVGWPSSTRRKRIREMLGARETQPLVVAAARHEWQKGLDVLLRAIPLIRQAVPDVTLRIGGREGAESARLRDLAEAAGLDPRSVFIGPRDDVPDLMCAADVFCVPSRWEGLGSIMIEAMALGIPVVAADIAPIRELDPGQEWVDFFTVDDPPSLASSIIQRLHAGREEGRSASALALFERTYRADIVASAMTSFFYRAAGRVSS